MWIRNINGYKSQSAYGWGTPETKVLISRILPASLLQQRLRFKNYFLLPWKRNWELKNVTSLEFLQLQWWQRNTTIYNCPPSPPSAGFIAATTGELHGSYPELQGMLRMIPEVTIIPYGLKLIFHHIVNESLFSALKQPKEIYIAFFVFHLKFQELQISHQGTFPNRTQGETREYTPLLAEAF